MKKLIVFLFFLPIAVVPGKSQNDTVTVGEDNITHAEDKYDRMYKLFVRDRDRQINHLWKLNLIGLSLMQPNIGYEQRISNTLSCATYVKLGFSSENFNNAFLGPYNPFATGVELTESIRLYHNINRRERLGKQTNGFSGNYFALVVGTKYSFYKHGTVMLVNYTVPEDKCGLLAGLQYGLQRRIGNIGYIGGYLGLYASNVLFSDTKLWMDLNKTYYSVEFGIRCGFAIDSFKNLHRMLK